MTPSGWEVKKLNELCEINPKKPSKPSDELVSFISMSQVSEDGQIISTETKTYDEVSKGFTSFKDKDVLVAKITPCFENGKGALAHTLVNGIGFGSTEFHVLRAKENTDPKFIYYLTRTDAFRAKGTMNMQGSAGHRRVTTDFIQIYKINTPPLPEQQKIAKILTTWDKAISITERLIENSTQQKKALMQQLLTGKKRLLDDEGERFEGEWDRVDLEDVCDVKGGKRLPKGNALSEAKTSNPYIRVADMYMGGVDLSDIKYVPESIAPLIKNYTISKDDLFITVAGTLGIVGKIPNELDGANLTENADKLTNIKCDKTFLLYVMMSSIIQRYIEAESTQNAQPKLALARIRGFKVPLPNLEEQQKIATVLTNADKEIELLEQQLADLQQEKKALMQVLLTGKKRVLVKRKVA
ncbi:restriction endonuclease subunit S [Psychrobacter sp. UBA6291]|uniref:restriction endonuclease subunit S n=1 Tax=Psychrobacter sp. UBA6291 TaxID=1947357 RepID=UPI00257A38CC|nr:restriction endonuclease subunit S [Psychrobacter sp. UBA6291]